MNFRRENLKALRLRRERLEFYEQESVDVKNSVKKKARMFKYLKFKISKLLKYEQGKSVHNTIHKNCDHG